MAVEKVNEMDKLLHMVDKLFFAERYERKRKQVMSWFLGLAVLYYGCHVVAAAVRGCLG